MLDSQRRHAKRRGFAASRWRRGGFGFYGLHARLAERVSELEGIEPRLAAVRREIDGALGGLETHELVCVPRRQPWREDRLPHQRPAPVAQWTGVLGHSDSRS